MYKTTPEMRTPPLIEVSLPYVWMLFYPFSELNLLLVNCFSDETNDRTSPSRFCRVVLITLDSTLTIMLLSMLFACRFEVVNVMLLQVLNIHS